MKLLWITNSLFPEVYEKLNMKVPVTVGWVHSAAQALLSQNENINLAVASFYKGDDIRELQLGRIHHFLVPDVFRTKPHDDSKDFLWQEVKEKFEPDVVHIHGSEYPHSYSYVRACGAFNVVLSIQGLVSVIERYYYGNISQKDIHHIYYVFFWESR